MQNPISSAGQLIVVELGAEWPSPVLAELSATPPLGARRVLAQEESESPAAFATRVGEQLDALFARGASLGTALIACSERLDADARSARAELARGVASAMARGTGGRLLLTASNRNDGRSRAALTVLETELAVEWQSAAIETKLRFAGEALQDSAAGSRVDAQSRRGNGKDSARRVA
jgi:hypothetical protein